jgi:hypothetical protein
LLGDRATTNGNYARVSIPKSGFLLVKVLSLYRLSSSKSWFGNTLNREIKFFYLKQKKGWANTHPDRPVETFILVEATAADTAT